MLWIGLEQCPPTFNLTLGAAGFTLFVCPNGTTQIATDKSASIGA